MTPAAGAAPPNTDTAAPRTATIPGVNLFATGVFRGKPWTIRDLSEMSRNARTLGPKGLGLLLSPAVLGHEETQDFLDRTDMPAAGWVDPESVRVKAYKDATTGRWEGTLVGDLTDVPPAVASMVQAKRYRFVSSEIYDDFQDDHGRAYGKTLRRVALLGGEIPQVKRLGELPAPVWKHGESKGGGRLAVVGVADTKHGTTVYTFAETPTMPGQPPDRQTMNAAIQSAMPNLSQSFIDSMSDDGAAELVKNLPAPPPPAAPVAGAVPGQQPPAAPATPMADPAAAGMAPTDPTMGGMGAGQPAAAAPAMPPADPTQQASMADPDPTADPSATADPTTTDPTAPDPAPSDPATDPSMMPREVLIANLVRAGQDEQTLTAMGDDDLKSLYAAVMGGGSDGDADGDGVADQLDPAPADPDVTQNADDSADPGCAPGNPAGDDDPNKKVGGGSATAPAAAGSSSYSEHANVSTTATKPQPAVKPAPAVPTKTVAIPAGEYESFREQATYVTAAAAAVKKTRIETFCEGLIRSGRYTPAEVDALVKPALANLNDTKAVHQFNEGGKSVSKTALGKKMAELEAMRKPNRGVRLGERFSEGGGGSLNGDAGKPDMAPVQRFAEVNAAMLKRTGYKTPKQFVDKMSEVAEKDPEGFARYVADLPAEYKN